ncbi:MAG TPA: PfkB family carbohydrate kinase [Candidatus Omnitrophota bacterium]|nr:PfkB family carbohydrate kinase [Candidatus Omnitrophota bacterium]
MNKLTVVGTVAFDCLETPFGKRDDVFGGSASFFSMSASYFTPVSLVAVVGKDFPDGFRKILEDRKIDLSGLEVTDGKTFRWKGKYSGDMNSAQTLETHLNVLETFSPRLGKNRDSEFVFLANVDPDIQGKVLDQVNGAAVKLSALDTMNYWIHTRKESLLKVLKRVGLLVINDAEARDLSGEHNLIRAARLIQKMGPSTIVLKKGEHGVLLFNRDDVFALPAYPLEKVFDPTGAGDTFAGGFMGYLAKTGDLGFENLKRAVSYGTVMASFAVEDFGLERLRTLDEAAIEDRLRKFRTIVSF